MLCASRQPPRSMNAIRCPMPWPLIEIQSWTQLVDIFDKTSGDGPVSPNLYRGQADASWSLTPSLLRLARGIDLSPERTIEIERLGLDEFRGQAHLHVPQGLIQSQPFVGTAQDSFAWWTLMQHHGAPTRLLDWTLSPYVATYFAVADQPKRFGAIWIFSSGRLAERTIQRYGSADALADGNLSSTLLTADAKPHLGAYRRVLRSDRMVAQQGVFTMSAQIMADHADLISELTPAEADRLYHVKLIIPYEMKPEFLQRLRVMNITASSLFPGVDGIGRSIGEFLRLFGKPPTIAAAEDFAFQQCGIDASGHAYEAIQERPAPSGSQPRLTHQITLGAA
jgi:hypothetical protein